jgi:predicted Zn-dependent protease
MGTLLLRVTGREKDGVFTILHDHPLSEDRLERLSRLDKGATGPAVLMDEEWKALKAICE